MYAFEGTMNDKIARGWRKIGCYYDRLAGTQKSQSMLLLLPLSRTTIYIVSQKNIPYIFGCNLKTNYQILIIFGTHISDTT